MRLVSPFVMQVIESSDRDIGDAAMAWWSVDALGVLRGSSICERVASRALYRGQENPVRENDFVCYGLEVKYKFEVPNRPWPSFGKEGRTRSQEPPYSV